LAPMSSQLALFKKISIAEGMSFLALLFIAMPMKYFMDIPLAVKYGGWAHGLLFIAYMIWLYLAADEQKWSIKTIVLAFLASLFPFGPFIFHKMN
jgi:integral membrane protein